MNKTQTEAIRLPLIDAEYVADELNSIENQLDDIGRVRDASKVRKAKDLIWDCINKWSEF